jgi:hypothetical protein
LVLLSWVPHEHRGQNRGGPDIETVGPGRLGADTSPKFCRNEFLKSIDPALMSVNARRRICPLEISIDKFATILQAATETGTTQLRALPDRQHKV